MEQDPLDKPDEFNWPKPDEQLDPSQWFQQDPVDKTRPKKQTGIGLFLNKKSRLVLIVVVGSVLLLGGSTFAFVALNNRSSTPSEKMPAQSELSSQNQMPKVAESDQDTSADQSDQQPVSDDQETTQGQPDPSAPTTADTTPPEQSQEPTTTTPKPTVPTHKTYTISFTNSCYSPDTITIANGDTIKFSNNSNKDMWPASDNHPSHTIYPEFDAGQSIAPGGSYSFTFTKTGTWGFHDHNKPNCDGVITVK